MLDLIVAMLQLYHRSGRKEASHTTQMMQRAEVFKYKAEFLGFKYENAFQVVQIWGGISSVQVMKCISDEILGCA